MKVGDLVWHYPHTGPRLSIIIAKRKEISLDAFVIRDIITGLEQTLGRRFLELVA